MREIVGPDVNHSPLLVDASEPGTRLSCRGSTSAPWTECLDQRTMETTYDGVNQTWYRTIDGAGNVDASPARITFTRTPMDPPPHAGLRNAMVIEGEAGTITSSNQRGDTRSRTGNASDQWSRNAVYHRYVAPASGTLELSTAGTGFDTVLAAAWDSRPAPTDPITMVPLGAGDDVSTADRTSRLAVPVIGGRTYLVALSGFGIENGPSGNYTLTWRLVRGANTPPTVAWTSPAEGTALGGWAELLATAEDDKPDVKVQFVYAGDVIHTATSPPFRTVWNTDALPEGPASVTARAVDADGVATSATRTFVVDRTAPTTTTPTVSLAAGQLGTNGSVPVTVRWSASDSGTGVTRSAIRQSVDGGPWSDERYVDANSTSWRLLPGHSYRFHVQVSDRAGNWSTARISTARTASLVQDTSTA